MLRGLWAFSAALLLLSAPAAAEDKEARAAARGLGEQGIALFEAGNFAEAFATLEKAEALFHAPTLVLYMASCRSKQGRLLDARTLYEKVLADALPRGAPAEFKTAQERAKTELAGLMPRIPTLKATVSGVGADRAHVTLDGAPAVAAELAAGKQLDPGDHVVAAEVEGRARQLTVAVKEGETPSVALALPDPPVPVPGSLMPAKVAFGVGGAFLVAAAATGLGALVELARARNGCQGPDAQGLLHCPPANASAASAVQSLGPVSGIAFGVAAVGAAAGTVLFIVRPGGSGNATVGVQIEAQAGLGTLALRGRF